MRQDAVGCQLIVSLWKFRRATHLHLFSHYHPLSNWAGQSCTQRLTAIALTSDRDGQSRCLECALRKDVRATKQPLSDAQYSTGSNTLLQGAEWKTYQDFITPQLSQLLAPLTHRNISVLEI